MWSAPCHGQGSQPGQHGARAVLTLDAVAHARDHPAGRLITPSQDLWLEHWPIRRAIKVETIKEGAEDGTDIFMGKKRGGKVKPWMESPKESPSDLKLLRHEETYVEQSVEACRSLFIHW